MRNFLRNWLGIPALEDIAVVQRAEIIGINTYLDSRAPCKICGHHRYTKADK